MQVNDKDTLAKEELDFITDLNIKYRMLKKKHNNKNEKTDNNEKQELIEEISEKQTITYVNKKQCWQ